MMTSTTTMIRKLVSKALLENNLNALLQTKKVPLALINMGIACYRLIPFTDRQSEMQYIKPTNKGNV